MGKTELSDTRLNSYLDFLNQGVGIFDSDLRLITANKAFSELMGYPSPLCEPGTPLINFITFDCERGLYGNASPDVVLEDFRSEIAAVPMTSFELRLPNGRILEFSRRRANDGAIICVFTNVTSARRAAELFERDSAVIHQLPDGVAVTDLDRRIISANPAFSRLFDIDPYDTRTRVLPPEGFFSENETELFFQAMDREITGRGRFDFELDIVLPIGNSRSFQGSILPRRDGSSNVVGFIALYRDVTARMRDQQRLRRQDLVIGQLSDSVIVTDPQGLIIDANPATERVFGYDIAEMIGENIADLLAHDENPSGYATTWEVAQELAQGRLWSGEMFLRAKDGRLIHTDCVVQPFHNEKGEQIGIIGVHRDITVRAEAEEALRRQALVIEHMWEAVVVTDSTGVVEEYNRSAARIFGDGRELHISEEISEELQRIAAAVIADGHHEGMYSFTASDRNGGTVHCDCVAVPVRGRSGKIERIISVHRDVTDRILQEKERRRLEDRMQQSKRLETLGQIAGGIAHDFNNILTPILGYAHLARDGMTPGSQPFDDIGKVIEAMGMAREMVRQILTFGQRVEPKLETVAFDRTIEAALELLVTPILPPGITLERRFGCPDLTLAGNVTLIQQLVLNLCSNAIQAMAGNGRLLIETDHEGDWATLRREQKLEGDRHVRLSVSDTGCGIDERNLERIFDPFFTTGERGHSTGLGLSVVHGVVKAHGGTIQVMSQRNEGTRFEIYFPVRTPPEDPRAHTETVLPRGKGETVLVVDDMADVRDLVCRMLSGHGYLTCEAEDGAKALEILRSGSKIDLLLTDLSMPGLTGDRLIKSMRGKGISTPAILMSALLDVRTVREYRSWGATSLLHKPIAPPELLHAVAAALKREDGS